MDKKNIIIGSLLTLLGVTFYFGFLRYKEVFKIDEKGYLFSSNLIIEKLNTEGLTDADSVLEYEATSENEKVYKKGEKHFIGSSTKKEVYIGLPSISRDGSRITNLTDKGVLVTDEFKLSSTFDNSIITDGKLYNGASLDRVDNEKYILIKSDSNIFINSPRLKIDSGEKEFEIRENSIINFLENEIRYYYLKDGIFLYERIGGISLDDQISFFDKKMIYKDFLINLELIGNLEFKEEVLPDIDEEIRPPYIRPDVDVEDPGSEYVYIKPAVKGNIHSTSIYSMKVNVEINDPARRIETSPTIEIRLKNRVYVKKVLYSNGIFDIIGLLPDTEFEVVGYYTYRDEKEKLRKYTFIDGKIKTNDISGVENIKLFHESTEFFPDKIHFDQLALKNEKGEEVLKGIKRVNVKIGDKNYPLSNKIVGLLKNLKTSEYETPSSLESNTTYDLEFEFYDIADNKLVVENSIARVKTSKQRPTVEIEVTENDLTFFAADILFENKDDVFMDDVKYVLTDNSNNIIVSEKLLSNSIKVEDLDVNKIYNLTIYGDYDIEDGKGIINDAKLRTVKISTKPISTLGFIRLIFEEKSILQNTADFSVTINKPSVDEKLLELLEEIYINVYNKETEELVSRTVISGNDIHNLKNDVPYDLNINNLSSKTEYLFKIESMVKQGSKEFIVNGLNNVKEFKTLKKEAVVEITNKYTSENLIDFDVRIHDIDGAILSDRAILEIRDSTGTLIGFEHFELNADYVRLTFDKLVENETYSFQYQADEYNVGYNNITYIQDKILFKEDIQTTRGIHGEIYLESLLKQITSENLFDINNNKRWKKDGSSAIEEKAIDVEKNTIKMSAKNGYVNYSYYLPEGKGKDLKVKFKARHTADSNMQAAYFSNGGGSNKQFPLENLNHEWTEYEFSVGLYSTVYVGFYIYEITNNNTISTIEIKDLYIGKQEFNLHPGINESIYDVNYIFKNTVMFRGNEEMPTITDDVMPYNKMSNGYAKITNTVTNEVYNFDYINGEKTFVVPNTANYKVELWGAAGGGGHYGTGSRAGRGGYSAGTIQLKANTTLYINVGGAGKYGGGSSPYGGPVGGYNGGGYGGNSGSGSGGGATDIRLTSIHNASSLESLKSRIIVAGGGGGSDDAGGTIGVSNDGSGGDGGGIFALGPTIDGIRYNTYAAYQAPINNNKFGYGGNVTVSTDTGGGGGGYYGGTVTNHNNGGAGGGSSYISGHIGCINYDKLSIKNDEEIDITYSEKEQYKGTLFASLEDTKNELVEKKFYIQVIKNDTLISVDEYDMNNKTYVENVLLEYQIDKNAEYKIVLAVKVRDRYYPVDSAYFTTEDEIRAIKNINDFFSIHTSGKYLVLNDLDFREDGRKIGFWFSGKIDFQGNKIYRDVNGSANNLMSYIKPDAVLENINVHFYLNNTTPKGDYYGLFYDFRGTVTNLKITVEESTDVSNARFCLISYVNRGVIENFVINNKAGLYGNRWISLGSMHNYGVMRNGYAYGKAITVDYPTTYEHESKRVGALAGYASENSTIENVFSTVAINGVDPKMTEFPTVDDRIGSLVGQNYRGKITNAFSHTSGTNRTTSRDANVGDYSYLATNNVYYVSDQIFNPLRSLKVPKTALRDKDFYNMLNSNNKFAIEDYVPFGYYPHIIWPDCMPNQEYIELPETTDADLVDIINVKKVENLVESAKVTILVNNPSQEEIVNIGIKDIGTVEVLEQTDIGDKSEVVVKLSNITRYLSKYYMKTITSRNSYGRDYTREYDDNERVIIMDMYRSVENLADWNNIKTYPTENHMLTTDLDFKNSPSSAIQINNLTGKINGNGHTIKNVEINYSQGIINELRGELKNLNIENFVRTKDSLHDRVGIVGYLYYGATIDNVHVKDAKLSATNKIGGLVGYSSGGIIKNSSVTSPRIHGLENKLDIKVGGLVAEMHDTSIDNCYVQDIDFNFNEPRTVFASGGIVGYAGSGLINSVYATGKIESKFNNTGGIVGYNKVMINNSYSNINLITKTDYIGGIAGYTTTDAISNSLSTGLIYSHLNSISLKRIAGNLTITNNNYAWAGQHIDGKVSGLTNGETLLTTEDLSNPLTYVEKIKISSSFDCSDVANSKLPKIYAIDGKTLLPNQEDNYLETYEFEVNNILISKRVKDADIQLEIENPNKYEITSIKVEGMVVDMKKNVYLEEDKATYLEFKGVYERAYDSYRLYEINYLKNGEEKSYNTTVKIEVQFYKDLEKYEDWQKISTEYAENYRVIEDIDFGNRDNVKKNVTINRLEGFGNTKKVLKNINTTFSGSDNALINSIYSSMSNIEFDNITLTNADYCYRNGLILYAFGTIHDVNFKNITLNLDKSTYTGMISFDRTNDIKDIDLYNITVRGRDYVSGFISKSDTRGINRVNFDTIDIKGAGSYVAGVIAHSDYRHTPTVFNITGTNGKVQNTGSYTGGAFGYSGAKIITLSNMTVKGAGNYTGGVAGTSGVYELQSATVTNSEISSTGSHIGGINGSGYQVHNSFVVDSKILGTGTESNYVGGITGGGGYYSQYSGVINSQIKSTGKYVGGIRGYLSYANSTYDFVFDSTVEGKRYVGGIAGGYGSVSSMIQRTINNATVIATETAAGGLIGYAANSNTDETSNKIHLYENIVADATVTAPHLAGAFVGRADKYFFEGHVLENVVSANVINTAMGVKDAVIGSSDYYITSTPKLRVYDGTTLNGTKVNLDNGLSMEYMLTRDQLATSKTYSDLGFYSGYFGYEKLSEGYFPVQKSINSTYKKYFPLPVSRSNEELAEAYDFARMSLNTDYFHLLPTYDIYVSDVDKINIEFKDVDEFSTISVNGITEKIDEKVFTFQYNFKDDLKIEISDKVNTSKKTYKASDLRNTVYTNDKYYYLINKGGLITNNKQIKDKVVNIFNNKVLLENGTVVNLSTQKMEYIVYKNLNKLVEKQELYKFDFNGLNIKTYYNYSMVGSTESKNQLYVRNGSIEMLQGGSNSLLESLIIDNYNDKNFLSILSKEGYIYNLKDKITYPDGFDNFNIHKMSNNLSGKSNLIAIEYEDGGFVVFDYRNGNVEYKSYKNNSNIVEYFKQTIKSNSIAREETNSLEKYNNTKKLIEDIKQDNILVSKDDKTNVTYIPVYKASKNTYDIYDITTITNKNTDKLEEINNSVTDKISNNVKLSDYYVNDKKEKESSLNNIIIFFMILIGIILSILLLGRNILSKRAD